MSKNEKENKRFGLIISGVFHVLVILLLFAFTISSEEEKEEPAVIIMDFTSGSSSKGGASSEPTPAETVSDEPESNTDPVTTQQTKSPVQKSTKPKSTSSSTTQTTNPAKTPNPNASASGAFNGNGSGQSNGDGSGNNDGIGDGENGPGLTGKIGKLGAGDGIAPNVSNPTTDQEGVVMLELTVDRAGTVVDVRVLSNHSKTTTTDPVLLNQAKKDGYRFDFKPDSRRAEFSKGVRGINYILQ